MWCTNNISGYLCSKMDYAQNSWRKIYYHIPFIVAVVVAVVVVEIVVVVVVEP